MKIKLDFYDFYTIENFIESNIVTFMNILRYILGTF